MSYAAPILLVVDADRLLRDRLAGWLRHAGYVVHGAADGEAALTRFAATPIDAVVANLHLPGLSGIDLLLLLKERDPNLEAIFLAAEVTLDTAIAALRAGRAYDLLMLPLIELEILQRSLDRALERRRRAHAFRAEALPSDAGHVGGFNPRELLLMELLVRGLDNREIAQRVGRSEKTVRNQLSAIYMKIGVSSRTQAVLAWRGSANAQNPGLSP